MTNSRGKGYALLDKHIAAGTEATYTISKNMNLATLYNSIEIYINGDTTAALALQLKLNAVATGYNTSRTENIAATLTGMSEVTTALNLIDTDILSAAGKTFNLHITLQFDIGHVCHLHWIGGSSGDKNVTGHCYITVGTSAGAITAIEIKTSTSTWKVGTTIRTYGIAR